MITTSILFVLQVALGTFIGNTALLFVLGKQVERQERIRAKLIQEYNQKVQAEMQKKSARLKEYIRMES